MRAATLQRRSWVPGSSEDFVQKLARETAAADADRLEERINQLVRENREIHEDLCINLNPATNVMNPKAEALLASGLGTRVSLGYPGDKYEMGLEAVEQIEVIASELAAEVFAARFAEIRVQSGAMANLYAFMATCSPGDRIIVPSMRIGGHVTHHPDGAAGLYGLEIHEAPVDASGYSVDLDGLRDLARRIRPRLITVGGSLNLFPHPVRAVRTIADEVGAAVAFDAAHLSGMIAGGVWPHPLAEGAHVMTMSTYKSLGGPPSGLIVTNEADLAQRIDKIAYPGLTANFDVAKSAALAMALLDWREFGRAYAQAMRDCAKALAQSLDRAGVPVFAADRGHTTSHQFAIEAARYGGGQTAAKLLRRANLLTCGIGLPGEEVPGDLNGLRIGSPEIARWGMTPAHMGALGALLAGALSGSVTPESLAPEVTQLRRRFNTLRYVR
ncbi:MAG TPA: aminotransferase class I/II-fold pyridoxal phosphate-dependent enzyme [Steroidobacteraceae bacterium]|jgi:glycine hydroxymethyltransferase|nr:aminotransferase class I/II-fold pyridoxal phosphate-dependent enzyme [Steroidobacteraceae bacterium]